MIPAAFDYERADSVDDAVKLLEQSGGDAKLIAGGHSLLPLMRLRLSTPSLLIDIDRISDLSYVREAGDQIEIGALSRMGDLANDPVLAQHNPFIAHVCGQVGDPQVRHRGTIGGSVAHGDPASDPPAALLALDAEIVARGSGGERTIPAGEFFTSLFETALQPTEVLTAIRVPKLAVGDRLVVPEVPSAGDRLGHRRAPPPSSSGRTGTSAAPASRSRTWTRSPCGPPASSRRPQASGTDADSLAAAASHAAEGTNPPSDTNGSAEYRTELVKVLVRRALEEATAG